MSMASCQNQVPGCPIQKESSAFATGMGAWQAITIDSARARIRPELRLRGQLSVSQRSSAIAVPVTHDRPVPKTDAH